MIKCLGPIARILNDIAGFKTKIPAGRHYHSTESLSLSLTGEINKPRKRKMYTEEKWEKKC